MRQNQAKSKYVIISAVKDEEKYIEATIDSVLAQTIRPSRWILVDDGSRDKTPEIISRYSEPFSWITLLTLKHRTKREPDPAVIRAFNAGYRTLENVDFDFIVKLDCDLDFASDYFEQLIARFQEDERLGIASGVYLENNKHGWSAIRMPEYHAAGASKMVRAKCFADIGGFVPARGWDTVDEIRAQMTGWRTRHFPELKLHHLRKEGSGIGFLRTNLNNGECYYLTGGGKLFFLLKVLQRAIRGKPFFLGAGMMTLGYLKAWLSREPVLVSAQEARFYQQLLNRRIITRIAKLVVAAKSKERAQYSP